MEQIHQCRCQYQKGTYTHEFKAIDDPKLVIVVERCKACSGIVARVKVPK